MPFTPPEHKTGIGGVTGVIANDITWQGYSCPSAQHFQVKAESEANAS